MNVNIRLSEIYAGNVSVFVNGDNAFVVAPKRNVFIVGLQRKNIVFQFLANAIVVRFFKYYFFFDELQVLYVNVGRKTYDGRTYK